MRQETFLLPFSTKLTEFEFKKIVAKVQKKQRKNIFCSLVVTWFFFKQNKMHLALEMNSTKS